MRAEIKSAREKMGSYIGFHVLVVWHPGTASCTCGGCACAFIGLTASSITTGVVSISIGGALAVSTTRYFGLLVRILVVADGIRVGFLYQLKNSATSTVSQLGSESFFSISAILGSSIICSADT